MTLIDDIVAHHDEFTAIRHDLHRNPGLGFQETFAAELVADRLRAYGVDEVHEGIGGTGVVGVLRGDRHGDGVIGLRADMDALPIEERTGRPYASTVPGVMHACGHDGHTATLLAAARYLAQTRNFAGTVHLIFQPAEEGLGGALAMIDAGLFDRFPCDQVYAFHNMPGLPEGYFHTRTGPIMAGSSFFDIRIRGRGAHAARPSTAIDPIQIAAGIVSAAQSIPGSQVDADALGVLAFTDLHSGRGSHNVIPDEATLKGGLRYYDSGVGSLMRERLDRVTQGSAAVHGGTAETTFQEIFVPLINADAPTATALRVARAVAGDERILPQIPTIPASEDFAFMTSIVPGNYIFIGAGPGALPHHPEYDFNDAIIPVAASYFCRLVEDALAG